jgi:hypothetical protein
METWTSTQHPSRSWYLVKMMSNTSGGAHDQIVWCPCRIMELPSWLNAAYPRSHRAPFLSRRRRLARYYTKKAALLSVLCTRGRRCSLSIINLDCLGTDFHSSKPAGPATADATLSPRWLVMCFCVCTVGLPTFSGLGYSLEPSHCTFPSLNCQMPGDIWAGPSCNRPVTARDWQPALFAPELLILDS